jgi:hypothetical protein
MRKVELVCIVRGCGMPATKEQHGLCFGCHGYLTNEGPLRLVEVNSRAAKLAMVNAWKILKRRLKELLFGDLNVEDS